MKQQKERDYPFIKIINSKMKFLIVLLTSLVFLSSCGSENTDKSGNKANTTKNNLKSSGEEIISSYDSGKPKLIKSFKNDGNKKVAYFEKELYEDGNVLKEGSLKDDKRHGVWKSFRRNGILWSEGDYSEGIRNGITITYHENGKIYYQGQYTSGLKSGIWKFYSKEGQLVKEEDFNK